MTDMPASERTTIMAFYRILAVFAAVLLALSRAHITVTPAGIPLSVPVLPLIAAAAITVIAAVTALLAWKIFRDWPGWRGTLCAVRTA